VFDVLVRALGCLIIASAGWPLWIGWRAVGGTTLRPTLYWLLASWLAWLAAVACDLLDWPRRPVTFLALALTACAGVSVLGARRPGLGAWNFVTLGLLAVLLMPLIEQPWSSPHWSLDAPRTAFISLVLAVGLLNYLPTRWGFVVVVLGSMLGLGVARLSSPAGPVPSANDFHAGAAAILGLGTWAVCLILSRPSRADLMIDRDWRRFRDHYGLMWAKRVQEQFNQAAGHAGHAERLGWSGLSPPSSLPNEKKEQLHELLLAVIKRFGVYA
jgi:hypothetical protein